MPSSSMILVNSPSEKQKPASILNSPSTAPQSAAITSSLPTTENTPSSPSVTMPPNNLQTPLLSSPVEQPLPPPLIQPSKEGTKLPVASGVASSIHTTPLSLQPSAVSEEEAKKAAATQAEKLNEKISKVKGKVVVSSNKHETKPNPSCLLQTNENDSTPPSQIQDAFPIGNASNENKTSQINSVGQDGPTPTNSEPNSTRSSISAPSGPVHQKQPSVHAHFLLNDVVHAGSRSRSGSASRERAPLLGERTVSETGAEVVSGLRPKPSESVGQRQVTSPPLIPISPPLSGQTKGSPLAESSNVSGSTPVSVSNPSDPASESQAVPPTTSSGPPVPNPPIPGHTGNTAGDPRLPQDDGKLHILLAATGSMSTGKLRSIINKLTDIYGRDRASIQIILTKAAENFVSRGEIPSHIRIWRDKDEWATWQGRADPVVHIELRRWADILVIAPLSANTLGKIALGLCDNLLTCVVRAWNTQYPILIAPAMVSYAYNHPATRAHLSVIKEEMKWIEVLKPVEKVVGSYGDIGMGGMMDWNEIVNKIVLKLGGYPEDIDDDDDDTNENDENDQNDDDDDDDDDEDDDDDDDDENDTNEAVADEDDPITNNTIKKKNISKLENRMKSLGLDSSLPPTSSQPPVVSPDGTNNPKLLDQIQNVVTMKST